MPITDQLVLPVDVVLTPVTQLGAGLQSRLKARPGEYALTRPRGRAAAKLVSAEGAALLAQFRHPCRVADAVRAYASRDGQDAEAILARAFPLLRDCFNDRFLVPAASPDAAPILPTRERGDRLGPFTVLRLIQLRDDTELYQARHRTGGLAAVKLVRPGRETEVGPMLAREAAALRHLRGRGAPALLAQGRHRGRPWLALSWCAGVPPTQATRHPSDPSSRAELLRLAQRITRAYDRLHRRGVLHGDVHPDNLLVGRSGEITILDFGLAVPVPPLRLGGRALAGGIAPYLPPEFAAAALAGRELPKPNPQSEQYAVAAVLYTLCTGLPYADFVLDRQSMLRQILADPPLPFARRGTAPWPELEAVLTRALAKDPARRYPSLSRLARAFGTIRTPARKARSPARGTNLSSQVVHRFLSDARATLGRSSTPPTASVMLGGAGVAYALYRLACIRDDPEALALADAWLTRVESHCDAPSAFAGLDPDLGPNTLGVVSPFHARSGVYLVRALIAGALGELPALEAATDAFVASSRVPSDCLDLTLGKSATVLGCAFLLEAGAADRNPALPEVRRLGSEVSAEIWNRIRTTEVPAAGMAHGWAGILYATLRWARAAGTGLPAAFAGKLSELSVRAEPLGRGLRWWGPDAGDDIAGWCNGPAGFIHLWTLAARNDRETDFLALAEGSAWSAWEARSSLANLCCGLGGRAYGLLRFYQHTGRTEWLDRAKVLATRAMQAMIGNQLSRERPLSLFKGSAGIAVLAADLDRPERAAMPFFDPEGWPG